MFGGDEYMLGGGGRGVGVGPPFLSVAAARGTMLHVSPIWAKRKDSRRTRHAPPLRPPLDHSITATRASGRGMGGGGGLGGRRWTLTPPPPPPPQVVDSASADGGGGESPGHHHEKGKWDDLIETLSLYGKMAAG